MKQILVWYWVYLVNGYECDLNLGLVGIFETIDDFEKAKKAYQEADSKTSSPENYEFWNYVITKDNINRFIDG